MDVLKTPREAHGVVLEAHQANLCQLADIAGEGAHGGVGFCATDQGPELSKLEDWPLGGGLGAAVVAPLCHLVDREVAAQLPEAQMALSQEPPGERELAGLDAAVAALDCRDGVSSWLEG
ncbi:hypothetical protein [Engelhardtia mirabilis]|uniref:hypothetical protein n=1 Tax=Engelhardtia mirabilis TaxID=2528011 RepID=UPI0011A5EA05